jgi:hypothetical protein
MTLCLGQDRREVGLGIEGKGHGAVSSLGLWVRQNRQQQWHQHHHPGAAGGCMCHLLSSKAASNKTTSIQPLVAPRWCCRCRCCCQSAPHDPRNDKGTAFPCRQRALPQLWDREAGCTYRRGRRGPGCVGHLLDTVVVDKVAGNLVIQQVFAVLRGVVGRSLSGLGGATRARSKRVSGLAGTHDASRS